MKYGDTTFSMRTAGVFLLYQGKFAFMIGPNRYNDKLGIVRLGGHIEQSESLVECVLREVKEEASTDILLVSSTATYYKQSWEDRNYQLLENTELEPKPIIIVGDQNRATSIYFAYAEDTLVPSAEAHGIILLTEDDVIELCSRETLLKTFMKKGGIVLQNEELDVNLPMSPGPHLKFLKDLMLMNEKLVNEFVCGKIDGYGKIR